YVYGLEPGQQRLVVVCDQRTRLVGSAVVKESDADPVVTIGPGATVVGRVVDADGNGIAGVIVSVGHQRREAASVFDLLHHSQQVVTDPTGGFRIDGVVPGHGFRLAFAKGSKNLGPTPDKVHEASNPGEIKNVGEVKVSQRIPE